MSLVTRLRCDQCRREVSNDSHAMDTWFRLHDRSMGLVSHDDLDFCSIACLAVWATSHNLVAAP